MMVETSNKTIKGLRCKVEYFDDAMECDYESEKYEHCFIGEPYNIIIITSVIDEIIDVKRSTEPNMNFPSKGLCEYDRIYFHPTEEIKVSVSFIEDGLRCLEIKEIQEKKYQEFSDNLKSVMKKEIDLILSNDIFHRIETNLNKISDQARELFEDRKYDESLKLHKIYDQFK